MVAALERGESKALAPGHDEARAIEEDARTSNRDLAFAGRRPYRPEARPAAFLPMELRLPLDQMAVIRGEDDGSAGGCRGLQDLAEETDAGDLPAGQQLLALGQLVVDDVEDHRHDPPAGALDLLPHSFGQPRSIVACQV